MTGFAPGEQPLLFHPGTAKLIKAGSKLRFQLHYTPNGSPQEDMSRIGFLFADPKKIDYEVKTVPCANRLLSIPPAAGANESQPH